MDIPRKSQARKRRIRQLIYGVLALAVVGGITLGLSRLERAVPPVDRNTVLIDTVKRGLMLRNVRGLGTLVPEEIRWVPAVTNGREIGRASCRERVELPVGAVNIKIKTK